jgi:hypothetical protein
MFASTGRVSETLTQRMTIVEAIWERTSRSPCLRVTHVEDGVASVERHRVLHLLLALGAVLVLRVLACAQSWQVREPTHS